MDILASDWSKSSNWSGSQQNEEEQDIVPFLKPDNDPSNDSNRNNSAFCPAQSRSTSSSNQTAVMITDESAVTGSSSFGQGSSRQVLEATWCTPASAELPLTEQGVASAQARLNAADVQDVRQPDATSDFSRSGSSNWSNDAAQTAAPTASSRFHLSQLIGRGAFGSVYKGSWKKRPAAIKASFAACHRSRLHLCKFDNLCTSVLSVQSKRMHGLVQVVEHDDGLLGEGDELDIFTTDLVARSQLDTASSSMNGNAAIMMEAALSSAVMHPNIVQTYDYETRPSSTSGGQVLSLLVRPDLYARLPFVRAAPAEC